MQDPNKIQNLEEKRFVSSSHYVCMILDLSYEIKHQVQVN